MSSKQALKKSKKSKSDKSDKADKAIEKVMAIGEAMSKKLDDELEEKEAAPKAVPIG
jgi:hypothetical protein